MRYIVQGQNIYYEYVIKSNKNEDGTFSSKPYITLENKSTTYENILEFENNCLNGSYFYISETEEVYIEEKIFRADENITYLRTNKVLSETDNKAKLQEEYQKLLMEYCKYICDKYPKVKRHIEIYNIQLPIEEIDEIVKEIANKQSQANIVVNDMGGTLTYNVCINANSE